MLSIYGDLHIHIGAADGKAVKITASRSLDLRTVLFQDAPRKGLDMVGIVDAGTLPVSFEIEQMILSGEIRELKQGGFLARNGVLLIAACELESLEGVHWIIFLPYNKSLKEFQRFIRSRVHNMQLSTQRIRVNARELVNLSCLLDGILCPAHAFTPHKGAYGFWVDRMAAVMDKDLKQIRAIELGLSADTDMADTIKETRQFTFLTNSDAHSSANVGREYNLFRMRDKNFEEFRFCIENSQGRRITANFGMDPRLGKYHRSYCPSCATISTDEPPVLECRKCGSDKLIVGVYDRITLIKDRDQPSHPVGRPPYYYRVPLKQLPGVGPRMHEKLLTYFENEINVIEEASAEDIARIAGEDIASMVMQMRNSRLEIIPGGGGHYGKVKKNSR
ncbi:dna helicase ii [hydrocarbon metagenome]|uniref:Dna helicase ii n=1 Tax=hydrocarbon metagenome TaxID=938273 RepID=A0A0W8E829_9ZZZZ